MSGTNYGTWGRRAPIHSTPDTQWTRCDGCAHFECIPQERSRLHPWRYHCGKLAREIEYRELFGISKRDCPVGRELKRGRRPRR